MAKAFRPGASAADVARSYGLNANQLFNWRRALAASAKGKGGSVGKASTTSLAACSAEMVPVGVVVSTSNDGLALAPVSIGGIGPLDQHATRYSTGVCAGLIEIDLVCGTRLRVDAYVDEHALRRVLSAIRSSS